MSKEEREAAGLREPDYLCGYVKPTDEPDRFKKRNGELKEPIRLYEDDTRVDGFWFTKKRGFKMSYQKWDGRPVYEDHCD